MTIDLDVTELNARTIPGESADGARVLERYREFRNRYTQLTDQCRDLEKVPSKVRSIVKGVSRAEAFAEAAVALDKLDDVIADANSFLNHDANWDEAWENQTRDLREDLDGIDEALKTAESDPSEATAASLLSFREELKQAQEGATRPRAGRTSILTTSYPGVFYFSAATMNTGYTSGRASVASAHSSSSSGYGSSGGSFFGAGSSSSF